MDVDEPSTAAPAAASSSKEPAVRQNAAKTNKQPNSSAAVPAAQEASIDARTPANPAKDQKQDAASTLSTASALNRIASYTKLRGSRPASFQGSPVPPSAATMGADAPEGVSAASLSGKEPQPKPDPEPPHSRPVTPLTGSSKAPQVAKRGGPKSSAAPNLVVPTFEDTFDRPPRSLAPRVGILDRTVSAVNSFLFSKVPDVERMKRTSTGVKGLSPEDEAASRLPKSWTAMNQKEKTKHPAKVCVIGLHGWFTQGLLKTITGPPTGTSDRLASMCASAVHKYMRDADMEMNPEAVTVIPLTGDGKVSDRVDKFFATLISNKTWTEELRKADAVFIVAHSQGAPVSTHLLARLIEQKHILPERTQVGLLALCGIHNGPFAHLQGNITGSYLHYFETAAAKELFDFQSSSSAASRQYAESLKICFQAGVKMIYIGSVDDQVVPLYSALHSSVSHPSILRALYVDGQAFPRTDFLINLLTFCVAVRNAGTSDHGLLTLLSSSVAGSLYGGTGHSLIYDEPACYDLAVRYLFETTSPLSEPTVRKDERSPPAVQLEPFDAQRWNPYQLPWALRGLLEDPRVRSLFSDHIIKLLEDYEQWKPVTKTLRDVQFRLQPMTSIKRPELPTESRKSSASQALKKTAPKL